MLYYKIIIFLLTISLDYYPKGRDPFLPLEFITKEEITPLKVSQKAKEESVETVKEEAEEKTEVKEKIRETKLIDPEYAELVGLLYTPKKKIALIRDKRTGKEVLMQVGDTVLNGNLVFIGRNRVVFRYYKNGKLTGKTLLPSW